MKISICILFISLLATIGQSADTNTYSNPTVGVTITKPADWQFATAQQHAENLARIKLEDEQLQEWVKKHATAPIVVMMKYSEPFDDVNPSFKVNIRPLGNLSGDDPKAILVLIVPQLRKAFEDFEMIVSPKETTVAGRKSAYAKINYTMKIPDGRGFPTCSELWVVPRGKYFFLLGSGTRQDEKTGKREDIQKILASLKLE